MSLAGFGFNPDTGFQGLYFGGDAGRKTSFSLFWGFFGVICFFRDCFIEEPAALGVVFRRPSMDARSMTASLQS